MGLGKIFRKALPIASTIGKIALPEVVHPLLDQLGGLAGKKSLSPAKSAAKQAEFFKTFASQMGIHPLAAMGANISYSAPEALFAPQSVMPDYSRYGESEERKKDREADRSHNAKAEELLDAQIALVRAQADTLLRESQAALRGVTTGRGSLGDVEAYTAGTGRVPLPPPRPSPENANRVAVYLPDGTVALLLSDVAERLGVKQWGHLNAGDLEDLVGEFSGNVAGTLLADRVAKTQGIPLFGEVTTFKRGANKKSPGRQYLGRGYQPKGN